MHCLGRRGRVRFRNHEASKHRFANACERLPAALHAGADRRFQRSGGGSTAVAVAGFNSYVATVEARLAEQHRSQNRFIAPIASVSDSERRMRKGESIIEQLTPPASADLPGAMLHDWRGSAFVPGATVADFERLMADYNAYSRHFSPQVPQARILAHRDDFFRVLMRVRQKHVITVVMDTTYDITYGRLDAQHGFSISRSTQIQEIASPGTSSERPMSSKEEHGFLCD